MLYVHNILSCTIPSYYKGDDSILEDVIKGNGVTLFKKKYYFALVFKKTPPIIVLTDRRSKETHPQNQIVDSCELFTQKVFKSNVHTKLKIYQNL